MEGSLESPTAIRDEAALLDRLRGGDEAAFETLVDSYYGVMLSVAQSHVKTRAVAEEVIQDAWLAVFKGLERFEGRSSLKTWIISIVINIAKTRGVREARTVPFATMAVEGEEAAVDPDRFRSANDAFPGHWWAYPANWNERPEELLMSRETLQVVTDAIEQLPDPQRVVITMRDVAGCSPEEVCEALDLSDGNQRVLLHRARSRVRAALERHLDAA
ncbi:MAG TPA: sigma-70 family RNA polymerase sigma factor [Thermoleophilaceae bacterium]|nr:sigma-70 family RNA polymerase sigma factor [Thermoleophilaceae bacterium]